MSKKALKITGFTILGILIAVAIIAMILCVPLNGKANNEVWAYGDEFDIGNIQTVEKKADKEFKIMMITDLQLWSGLSDNRKALNLVKEMAAAEKPDLIVTVGDNVSGITNNYLTKDFIKIMESIKIPWAPTFGNHDDEGKASVNWIGDKFEEAEYCLFKKGPRNLYGVGNYVINIKEGDKIVQTLFMFDNGRYYKYPDQKINKKEIWMGYDQIAWYKWNVLGIAEAQGETVPSMTFSHFAAPEFREGMMSLGMTEDEKKPFYVPQEYGFGYCRYLPGVAPVNSGFVDVAKEMGTHSMFFGHDHENNASLTYEGMRYTYGLKTGPSPKPWNGATEYGCTMITLKNASDNYKVDIEHKVYRNL